jgi:hypothetical protein
MAKTGLRSSKKQTGYPKQDKKKRGVPYRTSLYIEKPAGDAPLIPQKRKYSGQPTPKKTSFQNRFLFYYQFLLT